MRSKGNMILMISSLAMEVKVSVKYLPSCCLYSLELLTWPCCLPLCLVHLACLWKPILFQWCFCFWTWDKCPNIVSSEVMKFFFHCNDPVIICQSFIYCFRFDLRHKCVRRKFFEWRFGFDSFSLISNDMIWWMIKNKFPVLF